MTDKKCKDCGKDIPARWTLCHSCNNARVGFKVCYRCKSGRECGDSERCPLTVYRPAFALRKIFELFQEVESASELVGLLEDCGFESMP